MESYYTVQQQTITVKDVGENVQANFADEKHVSGRKTRKFIRPQINLEEVRF